MQQRYLLTLFAVCLAFYQATAWATNFPLKVSPNGRYLVDQQGVPFFVHGDSPWESLWQLKREEWPEYLERRRAQGFNTVLFNLLPDTHNQLTPNQYGVAPFRNPNDFSTVNPAYFDLADWWIEQANSRGMLVMLFPCYLGVDTSWLDELRTNGPERARAYGEFLAKRFGKHQNLMWIMGGDRDPEDAKAAHDALAQALFAGAPHQLITFHGREQSSATLYHNTPWLGFNFTYNYAETYTQTHEDWARKPVKPTMLSESGYERESNDQRYGTPQRIRRQAYWTLLSGSCGHFYGSSFWMLQPGWRESLEWPGARHMKHVRDLFESLPWTNLVPRFEKELIVGGQGQYGSKEDYVTAAATPERQVAALYMPVARRVKLKMSLFSAAVTARWYDPVSGRYLEMEKGPLPNKGEHWFTPPPREFETDWVLVLDTRAADQKPAGAVATSSSLPRLQRKGAIMQLLVDGKPFLMRGAEFSNNVYDAPDDIPGLGAMLDAYKSYGINTLLVPIDWKHLEPREGTFDYRMIDTLIAECRSRDLRVVVLWFGSIKNGGIGYAPSWFANDRKRFFRARRPDGKEIFPISPFCGAAIEADQRAFVKLMERIKEKDADHTVIMIQPENETGCQEIDNYRDHSEAATQAWNTPVPPDLMKHLQAEDGRLIRWLQEVWNRNGKKTVGTWPEIFGTNSDGQKIFMSYYTGRLIERVAAAGKAVHPLPMFINDWLGSIQSPGGPIGGPDYQVMDVYRVTTPTAFALCPDIYQDNFKAWLAAFNQKDNPILVPEARSDARAAQQCWYTYFQHDGLLFSPYMLVPGESDQKTVPQNLTYSNLKMSYEVIKDMEQVILDKQGLRPRELICFQLDKNEKPTTLFQADFHGYTLKAQATRGWGKLWEGEEQETPGFAAIVKMGEDDFVVIGKTMQVEFIRPGHRVSALAKGFFRDNQWVNESPQEVTAETKSVVTLTEALEALDQTRIRFEK